MKDSTSWAEASKFYEWVRAMDDMKDFGLWSRGSRRNEQLKVIDDIWMTQDPVNLGL